MEIIEAQAFMYSLRDCVARNSCRYNKALRQSNIVLIVIPHIYGPMAR